MSIASSKTTPVNRPLGYLRAFLTLLVVEHHASLAYFPKRPQVAVALNQAVRWWQAFPVVDKVQWNGFLPLVVLTDSYSMSLLLLISGLFTWQGLQRHGAATYLRRRAVRIGLPFLAGCALGPLAYYPAYLQSLTHDGFWHEWFSLGYWMAGPVWFLWLLLAFDLVITAVFLCSPSLIPALSARLNRRGTPVAIGAVLFLFAALAYIPSALLLPPFNLFVWGPFYVQQVRVLLYLTFFVFGVVLGAQGLHSTFLTSKEHFSNQWLGWITAASASFVALLGCNVISHRIWAPHFWAPTIAAAFALWNVLACFGLLACFLHFVRKPHPVMDNLLACSYGIYLLHYPVIPWTQYALLNLPLPAVLKTAIVFTAALGVSWSIMLLFRSYKQPVASPKTTTLPAPTHPEAVIA